MSNMILTFKDVDNHRETQTFLRTKMMQHFKQ